MTINFAIICMGRTGSTLLTGLLDSHPDIRCGGELFKTAGEFENSQKNRQDFLATWANDSPEPIKGFKMPYDWLIHHMGIVEDFRLANYKIIRLYRVNKVEHLVSAKLAEANHDWSSSQVHKIQTIKLDPWETMAYFGHAHAIDYTLDTIFKDFDLIKVEYSELKDPRCAERILNFLGAEIRDLTPNTVRARTGPLREVVENYDELAMFFRGGPYAPLFPQVAASH